MHVSVCERAPKEEASAYIAIDILRNKKFRISKIGY